MALVEIDPIQGYLEINTNGEYITLNEKLPSLKCLKITRVQVDGHPVIGTRSRDQYLVLTLSGFGNSRLISNNSDFSEGLMIPLSGSDTIYEPYSNKYVTTGKLAQSRKFKVLFTSPDGLVHSDTFTRALVEFIAITEDTQYELGSHISSSNYQNARSAMVP